MRHAGAVLALLCAGLAAAHAQDDDIDLTLPESETERLERIQGEMSERKAHAETLDAQVKELAAEVERLQRQAIEAAAAIQEKEASLTTLEEERAGLERRLFEVRADLDRQRGRLAQLIGVLQRMGSNPPPALLVTPEDATAAARSAMLLVSVMPYIEDEVGKLAGTMSELTELKAGIDTRTSALAAEKTELATLQQGIEETLADLKGKTEETSALLKTERTRLRELARESQSVAALLARLEAERPKISLDPSDPNAPVLVMSDVARQDGRNFVELKGSLLWPAAGARDNLYQPGEARDPYAKGWLISARPGAQVVAPADGRIDFADVYRGYGKLLIISVGDGYHILLAGLARIDVSVGQWVLAGEPIGVLNEDESAEGAEGREPRARLYVEIQSRGIAVDPGKWFSARGKVSG